MATNCSIDHTAEVNIKFANSMYAIFKEKKYGITTCCYEDRDLDIYNMEYCDLASMLDADLTPTSVVLVQPSYILLEDGQRIIIE